LQTPEPLHRVGLFDFLPAGFHLSRKQVIGSLGIVHRPFLLSWLAAVIWPHTFRLAFAAETNQLRPWNEYRTIMWVGDSAYKKPDKLPLFFQRLREMGINTAMVFGDANPQPLLDNHFPYYVENMVNRGLCLKFSSKVTDWEKFVTDWTKNGRPASALVRDYCLDDPAWRQSARQEIQKLVRKNMTHAPIAYDIRDELSTTISANPFDYDFNPIALQGFRDWLKSQYHDLKSLNDEWQTAFRSWDEVKPFTTDEIKNRMASNEAMPSGRPEWQALQKLKFDPRTAHSEATRWNFSPWADFRTYMDISLARALEDLRLIAHEADPRTPVGIEGTQMPSAFGGYDLSWLARVLDWVEPYDIGNARQIFGSFMPGRPILTTVGEQDANHARRRLWHLLLEGDRGCIVWWSEDCIDWSSPDYQLTTRAKALKPVLEEMTSPLAQIIMRAEREYDPIYIHYSQPSIQVDWLLESTVDGSTWHRRFSSFEAEHNRMARVRNSWLKLFQDLGYSPRFISSDEFLRRHSGSGNGILVMPQSLALSDREHEIIHNQQMETALGTIFADGSPGVFNAHGRLRTPKSFFFPPRLSEEESFVTWIEHPTPSETNIRIDSIKDDIAQYEAERLSAGPRNTWTDWASRHVGLPREVTVSPNARVRIHRFHVGGDRLLAFERNIEYKMNENLKQAGGNENLEKPVELEASLPSLAYVYDLDKQQFLAHTNRIQFKLAPWKPTILALLTNKVSDGELLTRLAGRQ
jgi:hypothetical protein